MNRITRGTIAELIVSSEATKRGFNVCLPLSHNSSYDLIVDGKELYKIQVKRAYKVNNHGTKTLCVESRKIKGNQRWAYKETDYDFLIACDCETNDVWIFPYSMSSKYKAQIYLVSKKDYENQWTLLGDVVNQ